MKVKLISLNPLMDGNSTTFARGFNSFRFTCPLCGPPYVVSVNVHIPELHQAPADIPCWTLHLNGLDAGWERVTIEPSIHNHNHGRKKTCGWHGTVRDGEVLTC